VFLNQLQNLRQAIKTCSEVNVHEDDYVAFGGVERVLYGFAFAIGFQKSVSEEEQFSLNLSLALKPNELRLQWEVS